MVIFVAYFPNSHSTFLAVNFFFSVCPLFFPIPFVIWNAEIIDKPIHRHGSLSDTESEIIACKWSLICHWEINDIHNKQKLFSIQIRPITIESHRFRYNTEHAKAHTIITTNTTDTIAPLSVPPSPHDIIANIPHVHFSHEKQENHSQHFWQIDCRTYYRLHANAEWENK